MSYPICKIKNITGEVYNIRNIEMQIDQVIIIDDNERIDWATDDVVLTAICDGKLKVIDPLELLITYSQQIDWLKGY